MVMGYGLKSISSSILAFFALAAILLSPGMQAFAAGTLTNEIVLPSDNQVSLQSIHVIEFTTGTTGAIKSINMTYPTGFGFTGEHLIQASGIGKGTLAVSGQTLTYTVNSTVSVPSGTQITIMVGGVTNAGTTGGKTVSVTTINPSNGIIDGPTTSSSFTLTGVTSAMINSAAVTSAKIAAGAVTSAALASNSVNSSKITDGSIVNADLSNTAAIALSKIASGILPSGIMVNSANIVDGSITKGDVAAGFSLVTENQQCVGKVVVGFDSSGSAVCKSINYYPDKINTLDSTGLVGTNTSIVLGTDGFPVISYQDNTNGDLKLVHCTSASCSTHDTPVTLDSTGSVGYYTSIVIGTDGFPVISYYDSTNSDLKLVHCTSKSCSTHDTPATLDSTGSVGDFTSIAIGTDGFPVISYFDQTNGDLKLVHCTSVSCSTHDTPATLDSADYVGGFTSIVIGTDGFPVISYFDGTNGDLKLVHCTSASCGTHDTPATLDSTGTVGQYISIAIGTDGFPVISYQDGTNVDLKLVHCTSKSCGTHDTPVILDSTGDVGYYTSIAIGTDGFPVISYYDNTNTDLKLVHCTSKSCSTHDTPATLDSTGSVGTDTSIVIGTDGFPVISYSDNTNGDLKTVQRLGIILS